MILNYNALIYMLIFCKLFKKTGNRKYPGNGNNLFKKISPNLYGITF